MNMNEGGGDDDCCGDCMPNDMVVRPWVSEMVWCICMGVPLGELGLGIGLRPGYGRAVFGSLLAAFAGCTVICGVRNEKF